MKFTEAQMERYSRNMAISEIGEKGQERLRNGKVLIIGTGGLGSSAALYLAAAGIGTIGIADKDCVDLSNLQRQIIHSSMDLGRAKVLSAKEKMNALNPDINIQTYNMMADEENIDDLIKEYDIIIDATDNFKSKFLINDACVKGKKPFVHAGIIRFQGQIMTYVPNMGPCYRCIFKNPPPEGEVPDCKSEGIIGAMGGIAGSIQAAEAIKYITGAGELLIGKMLICDILNMSFRKIQLPDTAEDCPACGNKH